MGRAKTATAENGEATVEVAYEPVFVHGLAAGFEARWNEGTVISFLPEAGRR